MKIISTLICLLSLSCGLVEYDIKSKKIVDIATIQTVPVEWRIVYNGSDEDNTMFIRADEWKPCDK